MTGIATLAAAAVVTAGTGIYEASQAGKIAGSQLGMSETTFGEQQGFEQQLAQLIKDPSSVTKLPGYQFNFGQGVDAVTRSGAATFGSPGSGNTLAALTQYGQNYAMNTYNQQVQLLSSLSGITAASSPAQSGSVATGAQANQASQLNNLLTQLGMAAAIGKGMYGSSSTPGAGAAASGGGGSGGLFGFSQ